MTNKKRGQVQRQSRSFDSAQDDNSVCMRTEKQKQGKNRTDICGSHPCRDGTAARMGHPQLFWSSRKIQKQIPFGNDGQNSKGKSKDRSFALLRMTRLGQDDNIRDAAVNLFVGTLCAQDDTAALDDNFW